MSYGLATFGRMFVPTIPPTPVTGILLRYAVLAVMDGVTRPATVGEIADAMERLGVRPPERRGKWVSDALRTEVRKGRIVQVGRNRYVAGLAPSERTRSRIRSALREAARRRIGDKRLW